VIINLTNLELVEIMLKFTFPPNILDNVLLYVVPSSNAFWNAVLLLTMIVVGLCLLKAWIWAIIGY